MHMCVYVYENDWKIKIQQLTSYHHLKMFQKHAKFSASKLKSSPSLPSTSPITFASLPSLLNSAHCGYVKLETWEIISLTSHMKFINQS